MNDAEVDPDRTECLGQIELNPPLSREQREALEWCAGVEGPEGPERAVVWEFCAGGCCLRVARAPDRDAVRRALQEVVDAAAGSGHRCSGVLVARRGDGELFVLRASRGRAYLKLLAHGRPREPRLAPVIPMAARRSPARARVEPR